MVNQELLNLSLREIVEGILTKKFSSFEVTTACLEASKKLQNPFNSFISIYAEEALNLANKADQLIMKNKIIGPLHGVPLAHKDTYYRKNRKVTCGSKIRQNFIPSKTSTILSKLDSAGAIHLGGLNTSDSGCNPFGLNILNGRAKNPWNPDYITGGSSSGSASAVSARLIYGSFGSDSGGSVRLPASMCGVVGLKPTDGLISRHGIMPLSYTLDCPGPLTRTVADCALLTSIVAGHDSLDINTCKKPVPIYERSLENNIKGLKIGTPKNYFFDNISPEISDSVRDSLKIFSTLGAEIVEIKVPDCKFMDILGNVIIFSEGARVHKRWLKDRPEEYTPITRKALEFGLCISATSYIEAVTYRKKALASFLENVFSKVDVLHTPTMTQNVPTISQINEYLENEKGLPLNLARNTKPANYMGLPSLSVPCGFSDEFTPISFQLIGPPFSETQLFNLGHCFQETTNFHKKIPKHVEFSDS